jgi:hypothetical protein
MKTTSTPTRGEKERKDKGNEKISDKKTEQEQCFIKLWETWKKMQAIGDIISYFFPYYFNCRRKKRAQKSDRGKIQDGQMKSGQILSRNNSKTVLNIVFKFYTLVTEYNSCLQRPVAAQ